MIALVARPVPLRAHDFPAGTPLNAFFAWNEARWRRDRRYTIACDLCYLYRRFGEDDESVRICVSHVAVRPVLRWRFRRLVSLLSGEVATARQTSPDLRDAPSAASAHRLVTSLLASIGSAKPDIHAAVFEAFEELSRLVDLTALARHRPRRIDPPPLPEQRKILVIKLSALGDFIQALGPAAAIRRHHTADEITLLTTPGFAALGQQSGFFDNIAIDRRPGPFDVPGWLALRGVLRAGGFDRVYDLQTKNRSSLYAWLFFPGPRPEWSGIARGCSHPHANLARHPQHTIDKQAEQLLMAGVHPTPLPACQASSRPLPAGLEQQAFFLLIPGSSLRHSQKRWPAKFYGMLAQRLIEATGILPVIVGASGEEPLATEIREHCPDAIDLVGRTELTSLIDLADAAAFTVGNDTGATHIAAAGGHPVVVLFSDASDPRRCAPRGREIRVLTSPRLDKLPVARVFCEVMQATKSPMRYSSRARAASNRWG